MLAVPLNQLASTIGADLSCLDALHRLDVLDGLLFGLAHALDSVREAFQLSLIENRSSIIERSVHVSYQMVSPKNLAALCVGRNGFELAALGEDDERQECAFGNAEVVCQCADMRSVLHDGVVEAVFLAAFQGLGPLLLFSRTEYPTRIVFAFEDEDALFMQLYYVDFGGASTRGHVDVRERFEAARDTAVGKGVVG